MFLRQGLRLLVRRVTLTSTTGRAVQTTEDRGQTLEEREPMEQKEEQLCQTLITVDVESDANQRKQRFPGARWTSRSVVDGRKQGATGATAPQCIWENTFTAHRLAQTQQPSLGLAGKSSIRRGKVKWSAAPVSSLCRDVRQLRASIQGGRHCG